jgi:hypothetical protein
LIDDLIEIVPFLSEQDLMDFLVRNSQISQLSAHINMYERTVSFLARGSQNLIHSLSSLNVQLCSIFSGFQQV